MSELGDVRNGHDARAADRVPLLRPGGPRSKISVGARANSSAKARANRPHRVSIDVILTWIARITRWPVRSNGRVGEQGQEGDVVSWPFRS